MAVGTLFNYVSGQTTLISDERYSEVGESFQLGTVKRAFVESDFVINSGDSDGTELVLDIDYEFADKDSNYTTLEGENIWTKINILNPFYETGDLFVTYNVLASYTDADQITSMLADILSLQESSTALNVLTKTDDYTISDDDLDGFGTLLIYSDGAANAPDITLPTLADNQNKIVIIKVIDDTTLTRLVGEGGETIEGMANIELPKEGNFIAVIGQSSEWKMLEESITCQLRLDVYAGYGSTDNKIVRLTNSRENVGNLFSENHSTGYNGNAEGLEITINKAGKYYFTASGTTGGAAVSIGLSLNSAQLTTNIQTINATDRLAIDDGSSATNSHESVSWCGHLEANDVIRFHAEGTAMSDLSGEPVHFTASYMGS
jgi:hypothetical protein